MYEYIKGNLAELTPTYCVIETKGVGYHIQISLTSFSALAGQGNEPQAPVKLFMHQVVREDAHLLFGFFTKEERDVFRMLISVSGVGANTARMVCSSMEPQEIIQAIQKNDVNSLKAIKGIGAKSAQRIIVDLKDKAGRGIPASEIFTPESNTIRDESLSALVTLGFSKAVAEKSIDKILKELEDPTLEDLIKHALKRL